jgi:hypothetical protein
LCSPLGGTTSPANNHAGISKPLIINANATLTETVLFNISFIKDITAILTLCLSVITLSSWQYNQIDSAGYSTGQAPVLILFGNYKIMFVWIPD